MAFLGARADRLLFDPLEFARALADIGDAGDDLAAVGLDEPRNDAGGVEAALVGDAHAGWLLRLGHRSFYFLRICAGRREW